MTNPQRRTLKALADGKPRTAAALQEKQSTLERLRTLGAVEGELKSPDFSGNLWTITPKGRNLLLTGEKKKKNHV